MQKKINKIAFLLNNPVMIDHYMPIWKILKKEIFYIVVTEDFKKEGKQIYIKLKKDFNLIDFNICCQNFFFKIVVSNQPIETIKKKNFFFNFFPNIISDKFFKKHPMQILGNLIGDIQIKFSYGLDVNRNYNIVSALYYDYIFCISQYELSQYLKNEKDKKYAKLKNYYRKKNYYIMGYPKYDSFFIKKKIDYLKIKKTYIKNFSLNPKKKTILWISGDIYNSSIFKKYQNFFNNISLNYNLIVRPHPRHLRKEITFLKNFQKKINFNISSKINQNMAELYYISDYVLCDYGGSLFSSIYLEKKYVLLSLDDNLIKKENFKDGNELDVHRKFNKDFKHFLNKDNLVNLLKNEIYWKKQKLFNKKLKNYFFGKKNKNSIENLKNKLLELLKK